MKLFNLNRWTWIIVLLGVFLYFIDTKTEPNSKFNLIFGFLVAAALTVIYLWRLEKEKN